VDDGALRSTNYLWEILLRSVRVPSGPVLVARRSVLRSLRRGVGVAEGHDSGASAGESIKVSCAEAERRVGV
jgi:hypothetical protein